MGGEPGGGARPERCSGDLAVTDIPTSTNATAFDSAEISAVDDLGPAELARLVSVDAALGPDDDVATLLEQSAYRVLRRGDGVAAVATLLRAADLSPDGSERARRLSEAAYVGAEVTGALSDVTPLLARARLADPAFDDTLTSAVAAASLLLNGDGDVDTAHRLLVGALHTVDPGPGNTRVIDEAPYTLMTLTSYSRTIDSRHLDRADIAAPRVAARRSRLPTRRVRSGAGSRPAEPGH